MAIKSKKVKLSTRERRKGKIRNAIVGHTDRPRITVFRSSKHTYAQIVSDKTGETLVSASTLEKEVQERIPQVLKTLKTKNESAKAEGAEAKVHKSETKSSKSVSAARAVGLILAERSKAKNISSAVFDRNGFLYSGRICAVADGAREGGLDF